MTTPGIACPDLVFPTVPQHRKNGKFKAKARTSHYGLHHESSGSAGSTFGEHHMAPHLKLSRARRDHTNGEPRSTSVGGRQRATRAATERWRRVVRPCLIRDVVAATDSLRWSPHLLEVLMQELYVDEDLEKMLGVVPRQVPRRKYAQAVAVALILRHSWRADDLASILQRLGLMGAIPPSR
jgi:hypothetical protein